MDNWSLEENYIIYIITYFKNKIKCTLSCSVNNRKAFPTKRHIAYKFIHPMFCDNLYMAHLKFFTNYLSWMQNSFFLIT